MGLYTVVADETVMSAVSAAASAAGAQYVLATKMTEAAAAAGVTIGEITTFTAPSEPVSYTVPVPSPSAGGSGSDTDSDGAFAKTFPLLGLFTAFGTLIV